MYAFFCLLHPNFLPDCSRKLGHRENRTQKLHFESKSESNAINWVQAGSRVWLISFLPYICIFAWPVLNYAKGNGLSQFLLSENVLVMQIDEFLNGKPPKRYRNMYLYTKNACLGAITTELLPLTHYCRKRRFKTTFSSNKSRLVFIKP